MADPLQHLFRNAFDSATIGMALLALDGRYIRVNNALCATLGYSREEFLAMSYQEITHPDDLERERSRIELVVQGAADSLLSEKRYLHKSGHPVWVSLNSALVRDDEGEPQCLFAQIQDITLQKEAELVRETFFQLPVALHFVAGFDGYFKKLSPSWTQVLGHPVEHLLTLPYMELVHPDDRERTLAAAEQLSGGKHVFLFENRYRHRDGSYRWILWAAVTVAEQRRIYGVALDYTVRKEMELKLEETLHDLERVVQELKASHGEIETLRQGLVTICAWTQKVQHEGRWMSVDEFLRDHLHLNLSHGISEDALARELERLPQAEPGASAAGPRHETA